MTSAASGDRAPVGYQHLVRIPLLAFSPATTRCGRLVPPRTAAQTAGLPICPDCSPHPAAPRYAR